MVDEQKTVLVVDDFEDISEAASIFLKDNGYHVITAPNGKVAIEKLDSSRIDIVITDILMPEMDGLELVSTIKEKYPDVRIILMSGGGRRLSTEYDYLDETKKLTGVNAILKKPFSENELIEKVQSLLSET